jgi:hypothetical protein
MADHTAGEVLSRDGVAEREPERCLRRLAAALDRFSVVVLRGFAVTGYVTGSVCGCASDEADTAAVRWVRGGVAA